MEGYVGAPHECLRTADIQALIFNLLTRHDCVQLARTCTSFYNQAMDVIWAEVTSIVPLVKCMPPDAISQFQQLSSPASYGSRTIPFPQHIVIDFTREPTPSDWQACLKHARRIRKFTDSERCYYGDEQSSILRPCYELSPAAAELVPRHICERAVESEFNGFLPKVKDLRVAFYDTYFPKHLPFLCGDRLRSLTLNLGFSGLSKPICGAYTDLSNLLPSLQSSWPCLSSLKITTFDRTASGQAGLYFEAICAWIRDLSQLQSFEANIACHNSLLRVLSDLPLLHTVKIRGSWKATPDIALDLYSTTQRPHFPSIRDLSLDTHTPDSPIPLLQALHASHTLTRVELHFAYAHTAPDSATQAPMVIEAISHLPSLESVDIHFLSIKLRSEDANLPPIPILDRSLLSPLFRLRRLHLLKLGGLFDILIMDEDLQDAGGAWPELEVVELKSLNRGSPFMVEHAPFTSLLGVQELYNQCPRLRQVDMAVNNHLPTTDHRFDLPEARPRAVAMNELKLEFCPLGIIPEEFEYGSEEYIAMAIRLMFPNLTKLIACYAYKSNYWNGRETRWGTQVQLNWEGYRDLSVPEVKALLDRRWEGVGEEV